MLGNKARIAKVTAKPGKAETEHVSGVLLPVWRIGSGKPRSLTERWDLSDTEKVCLCPRRPNTWPGQGHSILSATCSPHTHTSPPSICVTPRASTTDARDGEGM